MNIEKDGGPAFPADVTNGSVYWDEQTGSNQYVYEREPGMTLRDYFAAKAMASYLMPAGEGQTWAQRSDFDYIAETAYLAADAMLKARGE